MFSITLHPQSNRPAWPLASGTAARGLADATTPPVALRSSVSVVANHVHRLRLNGAIRALRERALAHQATSPSYAADLLAAANRHLDLAERA